MRHSSSTWQFAIFLILSCLFAGAVVRAEDRVSRLEKLTAKAPGNTALKWKEVEPGFSVTQVALPDTQAIVKPEVLLLQFDPTRFSFHVAQPPTAVGDIKSLTRQLRGIAGINASFFDPQRNPLGLLVVDGVLRREMQQGGSLLSSIFFVRDGKPGIVYRSEYRRQDVSQAVQTGPRLVAQGKPITTLRVQPPTRRSGIATTENNRVILFATTQRFPGASLEQIQQLLLRPELQVRDAVNFDGGSSSQLYLSANAVVGEMFIDGGEKVPVGVVVKRKIIK